MDSDNEFEDAAATSETDDAEKAPTPPSSISEQNVPVFRLLRKIDKALIKAEHHSENLTLLLNTNKLPKGLSIRRIPLRLQDISIDTRLN